MRLLCLLLGHKPRGPVRTEMGLDGLVYRCVRCEREIVFKPRGGWRVV